MKINTEILDQINQMVCAGSLESAAERLKELIEEGDDICMFQKMLGDIYYLQGQVNEAISTFESILKRYPKYTSALYGLGVALYQA